MIAASSMIRNIRMLTSDQAVDRLMHCTQEDLYDMCYEAHKDQYGTKGKYMHQYTVSELVNWWICHYQWNEQHQYWDTKLPFDNDDDALYETQEDEYNYYRQFG
jgi:cob(I)alamin adenosyltransferase